MSFEKNSNIKIGTCGYSYYDPGEDWKEKYDSKLQAYTDDFKTVEINKTFYKIPMEKTAEKWKRNAFKNFDFTIKAWQALTHTTSSPTWRNKKEDLTEAQKENFGYLRPEKEVIDAWRKTKEIAVALYADVVVIQTPGSFECSEKHENNMRNFFDRIDRGDLNIGWEPRGDWKENRGKVEEICKDLELINIVDLMREDPLSDHPIAYIRLHGLNQNRYNYNYDYSDEELEELADKLFNLSKKHEKVYCMFNNYEMFDNTQKLRKVLE